MTAEIIDGRAIASDLRERVRLEVAEIRSGYGVTPGLAVVLVGTDPASEIYVRNKARQTVDCGMNSFEYRLDASVAESNVLALVHKLNADPEVHGILVQLPLPPHIDAEQILSAIAPTKDVDGFHISNVGKLQTGQNAIVPCTPLGCLMLLQSVVGELSGQHAVVVGRSNIVGKPMAQLLLRANCTVTIVHSRTKNLPALIGMADIVVAAVGRPEMIAGQWLKPGAVVIDVGINRIEREGRSTLVGDVDFESARHVAAAITPVPGGVGPMTIACLLANTLTACCQAHGFGQSGFPG